MQAQAIKYLIYEKVSVFVLAALCTAVMFAQNSSPDNKAHFDKIGFARTAGVGYLARFGLGIDARYNYGLANILDDNNAGCTGVMMRNRLGQISLVSHFNAFK